MRESVKISARRSLRYLDARWIFSVERTGCENWTKWYGSRKEALQAALGACEHGAPEWISYYEFCAVPQEREISIDELRRMAVEAAQEAADERPT